MAGVLRMQLEATADTAQFLSQQARSLIFIRNNDGVVRLVTAIPTSK
jgi:hypothetical protein